MLEEFISKHFRTNGWTWKLKKGEVTPSETDVTEALDEAARLLYNSPTGTQLEVGRLIIIKTSTGHDVYVLAGSYE